MNGSVDALGAIPSLLAVAIAALVSGVITWTSRPLLQRYALARPNARSSHRIPTPQGAGIAVISATLLVASAWAAWANVAIPPALIAATVLIAAVGFADDVKSLPVLVRLVLQAAAVGAVVFTTPETARIVPALPLALERGLILLAGVWFLNLVNFMDGLDLMTVAEVVPVSAALLLLGLLGDLSWPAALIAAALCGAVLGFAPFNKPVAKVFLGDVGSLPIGLLLGWCLLELAWRGQPAAALLLPAYYLVDFDHHAVPAHRKARAILVGASLAFLPARHRSRLHGLPRDRGGVRTQSRARGACHRHRSRRLGDDHADRTAGGRNRDRRRAAALLAPSGVLKDIKPRSSQIPELHPSGWFGWRRDRRARSLAQASRSICAASASAARSAAPP